MKKEKVKKDSIEKLNDDTFVLKKNKEFSNMFETTLTIYNRFIQDIEKITKKKYPENDLFVGLIVILKNEQKTVLLNKEQVDLLAKWIDSICKILIEKDGVDLKNKDLNEYFKLASKFNKSISKILS